MDRSDVIELCTEKKRQDNTGVWRESFISKQVMCQVQSVSRSEFFEGGRNGLNPEYVFTVFFDDYNGEPLVMFKNKMYSVYRTYLRRTDKLELYCERKGGSNGVVDPDIPK